MLIARSIWREMVDELLPKNSLLAPMNNAVEGGACAAGAGHTFPDGEKLGAVSFISAIIFASSTYFSAMSGVMTMP